MAENLLTIVAKHGSDELVRYLQQPGVGFLVVGGTAVAVHNCHDELDVDDLHIHDVSEHFQPELDVFVEVSVQTELFA